MAYRLSRAGMDSCVSRGDEADGEARTKSEIGLPEEVETRGRGEQGWWGGRKDGSYTNCKSQLRQPWARSRGLIKGKEKNNEAH